MPQLEVVQQPQLQPKEVQYLEGATKLRRLKKDKIIPLKMTIEKLEKIHYINLMRVNIVTIEKS